MSLSAELVGGALMTVIEMSRREIDRGMCFVTLKPGGHGERRSASVEVDANAHQGIVWS
jgi:hypothetical protein